MPYFPWLPRHVLPWSLSPFLSALRNRTAVAFVFHLAWYLLTWYWHGWGSYSSPTFLTSRPPIQAGGVHRAVLQPATERCTTSWGRVLICDFFISLSVCLSEGRWILLWCGFTILLESGECWGGGLSYHGCGFAQSPGLRGLNVGLLCCPFFLPRFQSILRGEAL